MSCGVIVIIICHTTFTRQQASLWPPGRENKKLWMLVHHETLKQPSEVLVGPSDSSRVSVTFDPVVQDQIIAAVHIGAQGIFGVFRSDSKKGADFGQHQVNNLLLLWWLWKEKAVFEWRGRHLTHRWGHFMSGCLWQQGNKQVSLFLRRWAAALVNLVSVLMRAWWRSIAKHLEHLPLSQGLSSNPPAVQFVYHCYS